MPYKRWHKKISKKIGKVSEKRLAVRTAVLSLIIFGAVYTYINYTTPYSTLNKSLADSAVILMGLSMLLSSVCYFWDFADTKIIYRKHLGLVGFAYAIVHLIFSFKALRVLLGSDVFTPKGWAMLTAVVATMIFSMMAVISNKYSATKLGGHLWRQILRVGYLALAFIAVHAYLLKSHYWVKWWQAGHTTLPSMSLLVTVFIVVVVGMRLGLGYALVRAKKK